MYFIIVKYIFDYTQLWINVYVNIREMFVPKTTGPRDGPEEQLTLGLV